ncbi:hypothetical protein STEG23_021122 [Scotinomys teguina]
MQPGRTTNTGDGTMEVPAASHRVDGSDVVTGDERFTAACLEKNCQDHQVTREHRQRSGFPKDVFISRKQEHILPTGQNKRWKQTLHTECQLKAQHYLEEENKL